MLGEQYAKEHGIPLVLFPADWDRYGKRAGYIRNDKMARYASEKDGILIAFPVGEGESLHWHRNTSGTIPFICCWAEDPTDASTYITIATLTNIADRTFTNTDGHAYFVITVSLSLNFDLLAEREAQVEAGEAFTSYEPYTGGNPSPSPDYPQPIESVDALMLHAGDGTTDATGWPVAIDLQGHELRSLPDGTRDEMTLTYIGSGSTEGYGLYHAEMTQRVGVVDMGTLAWTRQYAGQTYEKFWASVPDMDASATGIVCTSANYAGTATSGATYDMADKTIAKRATYAMVMLKDSDYSDAQSLIASLNGVALYYPLATEQTYDLGTVELPANPAPDMTAWADGGSAQPSLSLTYERDLGIVIADMQSEVEHVWAQLAPVEQATATANHAVGTYLVLGGTFCKVTSAIATGEAVAIGTNVAATTVAAELLAIQA